MVHDTSATMNGIDVSEALEFKITPYVQVQALHLMLSMVHLLCHDIVGVRHVLIHARHVLYVGIGGVSLGVFFGSYAMHLVY